MKVCWLSNYFSPYKIELFKKLSKSIDLTAFMLGGKDENRNNEWKIDEINEFKLVYIDKDFNKKIKKIAKENDILIDSMYSTKYGLIAVSEFKKLNKITIMQADGGIAKNRGFLLNKALSFLMNRHDYFLSSSIFTDKYFEYYGVKKSKILHYRFTSLANKDINNNRLLVNKKVELRNKLNINDNFTLISVGQPIKRKGFDILLNAYIKTGLMDKINLYIIGGEPQEEIKQIVDINKLENVHFIGLIGSNELKEYYAASDAFVLCTREDIWGLVIEEALSFGLPVITSDNCVAGLHFNKLSECVEISEVNDIDEYAKKIVDLYNDKKLLNKLSKEALDVIKEYTIENSANDIIEQLNNI